MGSGISTLCLDGHYAAQFGVFLTLDQNADPPIFAYGVDAAAFPSILPVFLHESAIDAVAVANVLQREHPDTVARMVEFLAPERADTLDAAALLRHVDRTGLDLDLSAGPERIAELLAADQRFMPIDDQHEPAHPAEATGVRVMPDRHFVSRFIPARVPVASAVSAFGPMAGRLRHRADGVEIGLTSTTVEHRHGGPITAAHSPGPGVEVADYLDLTRRLDTMEPGDQATIVVTAVDDAVPKEFRATMHDDGVAVWRVEDGQGVAAVLPRLLTSLRVDLPVPRRVGPVGSGQVRPGFEDRVRELRRLSLTAAAEAGLADIKHAAASVLTTLSASATLMQPTIDADLTAGPGNARVLWDATVDWLSLLATDTLDQDVAFARSVLAAAAASYGELLDRAEEVADELLDRPAVDSPPVSVPGEPAPFARQLSTPWVFPASVQSADEDMADVTEPATYRTYAEWAAANQDWTDSPTGPRPKLTLRVIIDSVAAFVPAERKPFPWELRIRHLENLLARNGIGADQFRYARDSQGNVIDVVEVTDAYTRWQIDVHHHVLSQETNGFGRGEQVAPPELTPDIVSSALPVLPADDGTLGRPAKSPSAVSDGDVRALLAANRLDPASYEVIRNGRTLTRIEVGTIRYAKYTSYREWRADYRIWRADPSKRKPRLTLEVIADSVTHFDRSAKKPGLTRVRRTHLEALLDRLHIPRDQYRLERGPSVTGVVEIRSAYDEWQTKIQRLRLLLENQAFDTGRPYPLPNLSREIVKAALPRLPDEAGRIGRESRVVTQLRIDDFRALIEANRLAEGSYRPTLTPNGAIVSIAVGVVRFTDLPDAPPIQPRPPDPQPAPHPRPLAPRATQQQLLEQQRLEQLRLEQLRVEQQRVEQLRLEQLRLEEELERERLERERIERERVEREAQRQWELDQQRLAQERQELEQQLVEQHHQEQQRLEQARQAQQARTALVGNVTYHLSYSSWAIAYRAWRANPHTPEPLLTREIVADSVPALFPGEEKPATTRIEVRHLTTFFARHGIHPREFSYNTNANGFINRLHRQLPPSQAPAVAEPAPVHAAPQGEVQGAGRASEPPEGVHRDDVQPGDLRPVDFYNERREISRRRRDVLDDLRSTFDLPENAGQRMEITTRLIRNVPDREKELVREDRNFQLAVTALRALDEDRIRYEHAHWPSGRWPADAGLASPAETRQFREAERREGQHMFTVLSHLNTLHAIAREQGAAAGWANVADVIAGLGRRLQAFTAPLDDIEGRERQARQALRAQPQPPAGAATRPTLNRPGPQEVAGRDRSRSAESRPPKRLRRLGPADRRPQTPEVSPTRSETERTAPLWQESMPDELRNPMDALRAGYQPATYAEWRLLHATWMGADEITDLPEPQLTLPLALEAKGVRGKDRLDSGAQLTGDDLRAIEQENELAPYTFDIERDAAGIPVGVVEWAARYHEWQQFMALWKVTRWGAPPDLDVAIVRSALPSIVRRQRGTRPEYPIFEPDRAGNEINRNDVLALLDLEGVERDAYSVDRDSSREVLTIEPVLVTSPEPEREAEPEVVDPFTSYDDPFAWMREGDIADLLPTFQASPEGGTQHDPLDALWDQDLYGFTQQLDPLAGQLDPLAGLGDPLAGLDDPLASLDDMWSGLGGGAGPAGPAAVPPEAVTSVSEVEALAALREGVIPRSYVQWRAMHTAWRASGEDLAEPVLTRELVINAKSVLGLYRKWQNQGTVYGEDLRAIERDSGLELFTYDLTRRDQGPAQVVKWAARYHRWQEDLAAWRRDGVGDPPSLTAEIVRSALPEIVRQQRSTAPAYPVSRPDKPVGYVRPEDVLAVLDANGLRPDSYLTEPLGRRKLAIRTGVVRFWADELGSGSDVRGRDRSTSIGVRPRALSPNTVRGTSSALRRGFRPRTYHQWQLLHATWRESPAEFAEPQLTLDFVAEAVGKRIGRLDDDDLRKVERENGIAPYTFEFERGAYPIGILHRAAAYHRWRSQLAAWRQDPTGTAPRLTPEIVRSALPTVFAAQRLATPQYRISEPDKDVTAINERDVLALLEMHEVTPGSYLVHRGRHRITIETAQVTFLTSGGGAVSERSRSEHPSVRHDEAASSRDVVSQPAADPTDDALMTDQPEDERLSQHSLRLTPARLSDNDSLFGDGLGMGERPEPGLFEDLSAVRGAQAESDGMAIDPLLDPEEVLRRGFVAQTYLQWKALHQAWRNSPESFLEPKLTLPVVVDAQWQLREVTGSDKEGVKYINNKLLRAIEADSGLPPFTFVMVKLGAGSRDFVRRDDAYTRWAARLDRWMRGHPGVELLPLTPAVVAAALPSIAEAQRNFTPEYPVFKTIKAKGNQITKYDVLALLEVSGLEFDSYSVSRSGGRSITITAGNVRARAGGMRDMMVEHASARDQGGVDRRRDPLTALRRGLRPQTYAEWKVMYAAWRGSTEEFPEPRLTMSIAMQLQRVLLATEKEGLLSSTLRYIESDNNLARRTFRKELREGSDDELARRGDLYIVWRNDLLSWKNGFKEVPPRLTTAIVAEALSDIAEEQQKFEPQHPIRKVVKRPSEVTSADVLALLEANDIRPDSYHISRSGVGRVTEIVQRIVRFRSVDEQDGAHTSPGRSGAAPDWLDAEEPAQAGLVRRTLSANSMRGAVSALRLKTRPQRYSDWQTLYAAWRSSGEDLDEPRLTVELVAEAAGKMPSRITDQDLLDVERENGIDPFTFAIEGGTYPVDIVKRTNGYIQWRENLTDWRLFRREDVPDLDAGIIAGAMSYIVERQRTFAARFPVTEVEKMPAEVSEWDLLAFLEVFGLEPDSYEASAVGPGQPIAIRPAIVRPLRVEDEPVLDKGKGRAATESPVPSDDMANLSLADPSGPVADEPSDPNPVEQRFPAYDMRDFEDPERQAAARRRAAAGEGSSRVDVVRSAGSPAAEPEPERTISQVVAFSLRRNLSNRQEIPFVRTVANLRRSGLSEAAIATAAGVTPARLARLAPADDMSDSSEESSSSGSESDTDDLRIVGANVIEQPAPAAGTEADPIEVSDYQSSSYDSSEDEELGAFTGATADDGRVLSPAARVGTAGNGPLRDVRNAHVGYNFAGSAGPSPATRFDGAPGWFTVFVHGTGDGRVRVGDQLLSAVTFYARLRHMAGVSARRLAVVSCGAGADAVGDRFASNLRRLHRQDVIASRGIARWSDRDKDATSGLSPARSDGAGDRRAPFMLFRRDGSDPEALDVSLRASIQRVEAEAASPHDTGTAALTSPPAARPAWLTRAFDRLTTRLQGSPNVRLINGSVATAPAGEETFVRKVMDEAKLRPDQEFIVLDRPPHQRTVNAGGVRRLVRTVHMLASTQALLPVEQRRMPVVVLRDGFDQQLRDKLARLNIDVPIVYQISRGLVTSWRVSRTLGDDEQDLPGLTLGAAAALAGSITNHVAQVSADQAPWYFALTSQDRKAAPAPDYASPQQQRVVSDLAAVMPEDRDVRMMEQEFAFARAGLKTGRAHEYAAVVREFGAAGERPHGEGAGSEADDRIDILTKAYTDSRNGELGGLTATDLTALVASEAAEVTEGTAEADNARLAQAMIDALDAVEDGDYGDIKTFVDDFKRNNAASLHGNQALKDAWRKAIKQHRESRADQLTMDQKVALIEIENAIYEC